MTTADELQDELVRLRSSSDMKYQWAAKKVSRLRGAIRRQRLVEARAKATHTQEEWAQVLAEFDYRCVRCKAKPDYLPQKDHIIPIYQGGSDGIDNLQPLCRECNTSKGPDSFNWAEYRRGYRLGK